MLKHSMEDRWLRIHSLPGSKRYADTDEEEKEVLSRYNAVLSEVIGHGESILLISGKWISDETLEACPAIDSLDLTEFDRLPKSSFDPLDDDDDEVSLALSYGITTLEHGMLDEVLMCVAEELINNVLVVGVNSKRIFAPYDGGADIIFENSATRDAHKATFHAWLSARSDGY